MENFYWMIYEAHFLLLPPSGKKILMETNNITICVETMHFSNLKVDGEQVEFFSGRLMLHWCGAFHDLVYKTGRRGQVTIEKILKFATGASREPLLGFSMNPTIQFAEVMFPSASTCINQIVLPVEIVAYEFFYMAFLNDFFWLE